MTQPDGLEPRVSALEDQVHDLTRRVRSSEQDAAAARVLAGGADRDVAQIREEIRDFRQATTSSFNAMREDFADLRTHTDNGFAEIRGRLDATAAGQQQIVEMLTTLIDRQDGQGASRSVALLRPERRRSRPSAMRRVNKSRPSRSWVTRSS